MAPAQTDPFDRRLPLYQYAQAVVEGQRVLEIGSGDGQGAGLLMRLGAVSVISADARPVRAARTAGVEFVTGLQTALLQKHAPFDLIVVPEAEAVLAGTAPLTLSALRALLAPQGRLLCAADSAEAAPGGASGGGVDYFDLLDALSPHFKVVRMFGLTPFSALGIAEFDAEGGNLRVVSDLVDADSEAPIRYIALAGADEGPAIGYALVQIPVAPVSTDRPPADHPAAAQAATETALAVRATAERDAAETAELRRKLAELIEERDRQVRDLARKLVEVEGRADGVVRVSRAQTEELDELRGRLRRAAEVRAEQDEEITRLRRALTEADESVISLTRRTADEMAALAQQLTSGLRPAPEPRREAGAELVSLLEQLKQRDAVLAARESALFERDDRIAALEIEKQDLEWRLGARPAAEAGRGAAAGVAGPTQTEAELRATLADRERALREYQRAASLHLRDTERARVAVAEQAAQVIELQDLLASAEGQVAAAEREATRLRGLVAATEEADRGRRARLAELEGRLLRLQREATAAPRGSTDAAAEIAAGAAAMRGAHAAELARLRATYDQQEAALSARLALAETALRDCERGRGDVEQRWNEAVSRMTDLEQQPGGADLSRLRGALELSDENLRQARGQLLPLRGKLDDLERERGERSHSENAFLRGLAGEVRGIESSLRDEIERLDGLLGSLRSLIQTAPGPS